MAQDFIGVGALAGQTSHTGEEPAADTHGAIKTGVGNRVRFGDSQLWLGSIRGTNPSQSVVIGSSGGTAADCSALQVVSYTNANKVNLTPSNGMIIYNSSELKFELYENGSWIDFATPTLSGVYNEGGHTLSITDPIVLSYSSSYSGLLFEDDMYCRWRSDNNYDPYMRYTSSGWLYLYGGDTSGDPGTQGATFYFVAGSSATALTSGGAGKVGGSFYMISGNGAAAGYNTETAGDGGTVLVAGGGGGAAKATSGGDIGNDGGQGGHLIVRSGWGGPSSSDHVAGDGGLLILVAGGGGSDDAGGGPGNPGHAYLSGSDTDYTGDCGNVYIAGGRSHINESLSAHGDVHLGSIWSQLISGNYYGRTRAIYIGNDTDRPISTAYGHMKHEDYQVPETGTAVTGGSTWVRLGSGASSEDNYYQGWTIDITGGLGAGQTKRISYYVGSSKDAYISPDTWTTTPDNTSTYSLRYDFGLKVPVYSGVPSRTDSFIETGDLVYDSNGDDLYIYTGAAWSKTSGPAVTLDTAYNNGSSITVDSGPVILNCETVANDALQISWSGAMSSGSDIYGIDLIGQTNSSTGQSVGIKISGFDQGIHLYDNQELYFGTGKDAFANFDGTSLTIQTIDPASLTASDPVVLESGATDQANSGSVTIQTGNATTSGNSGDINLTTGTSAATRGDVKITADQLDLTGLAASTGQIALVGTTTWTWDSTTPSGTPGYGSIWIDTNTGIMWIYQKGVSPDPDAWVKVGSQS